MSVINSSDNAIIVKKPTYIVLTEFTGEETDGVAAGDNYILEEVIRDTTTITQDDPDETKIERETNDIPIDYIYTLGDYSFEAEVANMSSEMLKALAGWTVNDDGTSYAPTVYSDKYVQVDIVLPKSDGTLIAIQLYKLKLTSSLLIEALNTNVARIKLAGKGVVTTDADGVQRVAGVMDGYTVPTESSEEEEEETTEDTTE